MMDAHKKLLEMNGIKGVEVSITHDSPWHPELMSESAKVRLGFDTSRLDASQRQVPEIQVKASRR